MSSIGWRDGKSEALLGGEERAYMGVFADEMMEAVLGSALDVEFVSGGDDGESRYEMPPVMRLMEHRRTYVFDAWEKALLTVRPVVYVRHIKSIQMEPLEKMRFEQSLRVHLRSDHDATFLMPVPLESEPKQVNVGCVALNTVLAMGGDALKLLARLHGQCEAHCWVDGPNRAWLADIIDEGRACNVLRGHLREWGTWARVSAFLRERDDEAVVCDYSVSDSFPSAWFVEDYLPEYVGRWTKDGQEGDSWFDLPEGEGHRLGVEALRARDARLAESYPDWRYELEPEHWSALRYEWGMSAFDVRDYLTAVRHEAEGTTAHFG